MAKNSSKLFQKNVDRWLKANGLQGKSQAEIDKKFAEWRAGNAGLPEDQQFTGTFASNETLWNNSRKTGSARMPTTVSYGTPSANADWWKNLAYQGGGEAELLASSANALLPSFANDDQSSIAKWLGQNFKDFTEYQDATIAPSTASSGELRNQFFSKERAQKALTDLEAMRSAMGRGQDQMGTGYNFLKKTLALLDKYGTDGTTGISRATFAEMQKEFETISSGIDSSYVELGKAFINPSAGGSQLMQSFRNNGRDSFGIPNASLFV